MNVPDGQHKMKMGCKKSELEHFREMSQSFAARLGGRNLFYGKKA